MFLQGEQVNSVIEITHLIINASKIPNIWNTQNFDTANKEMMSHTELKNTLKQGRIRCNSFPFDVQHSRNNPEIFRREGIVGEFHFQSSATDKVERKRSRKQSYSEEPSKCQVSSREEAKRLLEKFTSPVAHETIKVE